MDPGRIRQALVDARLLFLAALVAGVAGAIPLAELVAPLEYLARASFVWERPPSSEEGGGGDARALRTMIDSVELPTNLAEVRRKLHVHKTLPELGGAVHVTTEDGSNLVVVTARDDDPRAAAAIANTLVEVFLAQRRAYEQKRRTDQARMLELDVQRARTKLDDAEGRYDRFRTAHGITDLSLDTQRAIEDAASLRASAELAQADASAEEARAKVLRSEANRLPATTVRESVTEQAVVSPEQQRLAQARLELAEMRARLSEEHPSVQALEAQIEVLREAASRPGSGSPTRQTSRVQSPDAHREALRGTLAGSEAQRQVAIDRTRSYEELEAAARERLRQLSAVEGEASGLLAAQRVAEAHLLELDGLAARAADEAHSPGSGLRFIARAAVPDSPESKAKQRVVIAVVPLVALLIVLAMVLLRNVRGLKVYTATELAYWGGGPVVGSSMWPRDPESLYALVEELDDLYPQALGTTLVVGATPIEREAARHVAEIMADTRVERVEQPQEVSEPEGPISAPESWSTLARVPRDGGELARVEETALSERVTEWKGEESGPALRRAARLADRVLVLVRAGALTPVQAASIRTRLGREEGVGFIVVGLEPEHGDLPDRAGPVEEFWRGQRR